MSDIPHWLQLERKRHYWMEFPQGSSARRSDKGMRVPGTLDSTPLHVLAATQGLWGERIADNVATHAPATWQVDVWSAPRVIPPVVDDPTEFLPAKMPSANLILALGEVPGFAQLIPELARLTGARSVIAPIDRNESLPEGLATQLDQWLQAMQVVIIFPKPFCSLTERSYNRTPLVKTYDDPIIREFAAHFGRPQFRVSVDAGCISEVVVERDSACGCAHHVAEGLVGTPVDEAVEKAGLLHHHFPCLASMNKDPDYLDTLMHVSGDYVRDAIKQDIRPYLTPVPYLRPSGRVDQELP